MASQRFLDLLQALKHGTEGNQIFWEDLPDEEMFRTQVGGGLVRIGRVEGGSGRGYALWLIGQGGAVAAEVEFYPGEPGYGLIEDVYSSARLRARGGDMLIDNIIRQLTPAR